MLKDELIANYYNEISSEYFNYEPIHSRINEDKKILNRIQKIKQKGKVLEIGCGNGFFLKLFKTKGTFKIGPDKPTASIKTSNYANTDSPSKLYSNGKPAYMSYYLKKVSGLEKLIESNIPDKNKSLVEYRKDLLKLTFTEDVSLDMGTLAYLYKLLYWSKPNGKNIVPENLLRFNCDIVI